MKQGAFKKEKCEADNPSSIPGKREGRGCYGLNMEELYLWE
jgi:hypothetical protein